MTVEFEDLFPADIESKGTVAVREEPKDILEEFDPGKWMKASEVAALFGVDPKTVASWQKNGKLDKIRYFKTPGGHRRFSREDIVKLMEANES